MSKYSLALTMLLVVALMPRDVPAGSDLAREGRWADEIGDAIMTGDVTWLKAGGHEFMAIHTEAGTDTPRGAVIVLHGIGVHPNWPDVIYPLRTRLPETGWATLSIQLPVLAADAKGSAYMPILPEVVPRLDAALAFLREQGHERIAVVAHSLGSIMATYWLTSAQPQGIVGYAGIGMTDEKDAEGNGIIAHLAQLKLPVLDLYGADDLPHVLAEAPARAASAANGSSAFQQTMTPGANHFFRGKEDELVEVVLTWLEQL